MNLDVLDRRRQLLEHQRLAGAGLGVPLAGAAAAGEQGERVRRAGPLRRRPLLEHEAGAAVRGVELAVLEQPALGAAASLPRRPAPPLHATVGVGSR
jgi:hypothetical protein